MATSSNSGHLLIHDANGQQRIIKILPNNSGQQLRAITKNVIRPAEDSKMLGQRNFNNTSLPMLQSNAHQVATVATTRRNNSIKVTPQQMTTLKLGNHIPSNTRSIVQVGNDAGSHNSHSKTINAINNISHNSHMIKKDTQSVQNYMRRRRNADRSGKGLRHFSMKVCKKVEEKGKTTYNEVADELVEEEAKGQPLDSSNYDQKNIRRRVYDALNVLMAMNIISKDKKEIRWIGLPTNSAQQCSALENEIKSRKERIESKQHQLRELILQQISFKSLVTRNQENEERGLIPSQNSAIQLPFITVNAHKKTQINCMISDDKSEYSFSFDDNFEIHDDVEVLKRMGLLLGLDKGECVDIERVKAMVPKSFQKYVECYGRNELDILMENDWENSRILNIMDQSIEPDEMKPKPYGTVLKLEQYEEDIYDDDDSENSNID